jgi:hypothetical protein
MLHEHVCFVALRNTHFPCTEPYHHFLGLVFSRICGWRCRAISSVVKVTKRCVLVAQFQFKRKQDANYGAIHPADWSDCTYLRQSEAAQTPLRWLSTYAMGLFSRLP